MIQDTVNIEFDVFDIKARIEPTTYPIWSVPYITITASKLNYFIYHL